MLERVGSDSSVKTNSVTQLIIFGLRILISRRSTLTDSKAVLSVAHLGLSLHLIINISCHGGSRYVILNLMSSIGCILRKISESNCISGLLTIQTVANYFLARIPNVFRDLRVSCCGALSSKSVGLSSSLSLCTCLTVIIGVIGLVAVE